MSLERRRGRPPTVLTAPYLCTADLSALVIGVVRPREDVWSVVYLNGIITVITEELFFSGLLALR